jgi:hypothetical protein
LIDYLKTDQEELLKDITDHRKNASIIEPRAKKQMTMKIRTINIKNTDSFDLDSFSKFVFNDFDNNKNVSEVLNEQNNRNDKTEPREESLREERTRQIEAIDFEQQRINKIVETARNRQLRNRAEANTVEFRIGFTRRHLVDLFNFFKSRQTVFVQTRKDEVREKLKKRREETKRHEKENKK